MLEDTRLTRGRRSARSLAAAFLFLALLYLWILPLARPRGYYLWGHYQLRDLYFGIPVALAAACVLGSRLAPAPRRREVALRLTTAALAAGLAIFGADGAYTLGYLKVWRADYWFDEMGIPRKDHLPDPELGFARRPLIHWRGRKSAVTHLIDYRTDEHGFRNPPGLRRADLVFIGDSFTEAVEVAEEASFPARVAAAGTRAAGAGWRAANLGRGSYGPQQELVVLRRYGLGFHPRVVIWQLFEGNDLRDAEEFLAWERDPHRVARVPLRQRYLDNSLLNMLFSTTLPPTRPDPRMAPATVRYADGTSQRGGIFYRYVPDGPDRYPAGFAETKRSLETGDRLCRAQGVPMVVLLVPVLARVLAPHLVFDRPADRAAYLPGEGRPAPRDFNRRITELCGDLGCPVVDAYPALRARAEQEARGLYVLNDEHLDTVGHEVVAQALLEALRARGLLARP
jgi:hypothetical protein